jgi:potassium/chloride transporter 9
MLAMLIVSYAINLLTVLSVSAIATNGKVKGGGAYYMISRSLGPEFGGSIGLVFYIGQVLNAGMNVIGFVEPLLSNFGESNGELGSFLPEVRKVPCEMANVQGRWWEFLYASTMLLVVTLISLVGSKAFSRASGILFLILMVSSLSIPLSSFLVSPFSKSNRSGGIIVYTGISLKSLRENLWPRFTSGAAGSSKPLRPESIASVFGVFFPATAGVFAGASMSGDLKNPSVSIPRGTLAGMGLTFFIYIAVIFAMASTVTRNTLYTDISVMQDVSPFSFVSH